MAITRKERRRCTAAFKIGAGGGGSEEVGAAADTIANTMEYRAVCVLEGVLRAVLVGCVIVFTSDPHPLRTVG